MSLLVHPGLADIGTEQLLRDLLDARARELELVADLTEEQLRGPYLPDIEPPIWELGHVGWFQEWWILRLLDGATPVMPSSDPIYDSTKVFTRERWGFDFPSLEDTVAYISTVLEKTAGRLRDREAAEQEKYYYLLATYHEDMHAETLTFIRQAFGYPAPSYTKTAPPHPVLEIDPGFSLHDVFVPGGSFMLGSTPDTPFVFDNEKWAHPVDVQPFSISATPVTNAQFQEFVEDGGYQKKELWGRSGKSAREWLRRSEAQHPLYWERGSDGRWYQRLFDRLEPLDPYQPVVHVNWYEASAYCRWADRRLPTEAEWEMAAAAEPAPGGGVLAGRRRRYPWGDEPPAPDRANLDGWGRGVVDVRAFPAGDSAFGCRQMLGNVWEWTEDTFQPYPGFEVDPYREYSEPSFGKKKVLRGGCWATRARLIRNTWRNFYMPSRSNIFAGFRTCAL